MKNFIFSILLVLAALAPATASAADTLFPYPTPPDSMEIFQNRCDYIVSRFWNRCNFDQAMRNPDRFNEAFGAWIGIMPHASADTVFTAIDKLLSRFEKKGGPETLQLARMAEGWVYSDTTDYNSDDLMKPFATAAAHHKKIKKDDRAHFAAIEQILNSSAVGATVPDIPYILPDGSKGHLSDAESGSILMIFNSPDNPAGSIARIRLDTDPAARELIANGELSIINVYPGPADEKWIEAAKSYPDNWLNVAMPDAGKYFRLGDLPQLFFLSNSRKVLAKNLSVDYMLGAFKVTTESRKKK